VQPEEKHCRHISPPVVIWRVHLLPPGQRGSGVEIILLIANYPWHMRQFWLRHPDGYLLRPARRLV